MQQQNQLLENYVLLFILAGIIVGFISRLWILKSDVRQYPTLPNGYLIHMTTGFIAASMGAVAFPALRSKNYIAVTFLATAIQQFRDIRRSERESLESLERDIYAPRGASYIDGIAKTFEARNYIVIISSLATTVTAFILKNFIVFDILVLIGATVMGFLVTFVLKTYTKGHSLRDIITVEEAPLEFRDGYNLYVGDIFIMNIGLPIPRERILQNGIGLILIPKNNNPNETIILHHKGQRDAIVHECSRLLGLERYAATRKDYKTGRVAMIIVPIVKDKERLKEIILSIPILETVRKVKS